MSPFGANLGRPSKRPIPPPSRKRRCYPEFVTEAAGMVSAWLSNALERILNCKRYVYRDV
jgi:hypothetical protein